LSTRKTGCDNGGPHRIPECGIDAIAPDNIGVGTGHRLNVVVDFPDLVEGNGLLTRGEVQQNAVGTGDVVVAQQG